MLTSFTPFTTAGGSPPPAASSGGIITKAQQMRQVIPAEKLPELVHVLQLKTRGDDTTERRDALACLLGLTGLRKTEVLNLRTYHLDLATQSIAVRTLKGGCPRSVPLDLFTWSQLARQAQNAIHVKRTLIFATSSGAPLDGRNLLRTWHRWSTLHLGRPYRFHDLRHTAAQVVYNESGHDIIAVQQLLGHRNIATTQEYLTSTKDVRNLLPTNKGLANDRPRMAD